MVFRFMWKDPRLNKLNSSLVNSWQNINVQTARDKIFIPDIYIYKLVQQTSNSVFGRTIEAFYHGPNSTIREI